jgi:hypothetical protein
MQTLEHFEHIGSRGIYRPVGVVTFEQAVDLLVLAMQHARSLGLAELLMNAHGLSGFSSPSTFSRYSMAVRGAESGAGVLRLAIVVQAGLIDPQKIGVVMAQNRGLDSDVFSNETDAIKWLDSRAASRR